MTGMLVMATVAILVFVLILLGAPGLFRPLVTYHLYVDNAAAIKLGAPVMLAGRKIGQVNDLYSPVSADESKKAEEIDLQIHPPAADASPTATPKNAKKFEARIDVQVDKKALVYRDAKPRLMTLGLLGEEAVDITEGNESSGRAQDGQMFAAERAPDFSEAASKMVAAIEPVAKEATGALKDLQSTAQNLNRITDDDSQLNMAIAQFRTFAENITSLTARNSSLNQSLDNIKDISSQLSENDNLKLTLQNFRDSSEKLRSTMNSIAPDITAVGANLKDATATVKSEPWRLIWPSTKKYPEQQQQAASKKPSDTITVRKTTKATPSPSPSKRQAIVP
jgi:ABC-type transporter Mla subunit MlaD